MQQGSLNVVLDAFWGSSGKGKVCDWLVATRAVTDVISGNMPNAGHTVVRGSRKVVKKVLPSGAAFNGKTRIWLGPNTGFFQSQLETEARWVAERQILMHDRAFVVREQDAEAERAGLSYVASTMQGSGNALARKIMRKDGLPLTGLAPLPKNVEVIESKKFRAALCDRIVRGTALYEVSQGWGLSVDHGTHYPYCTSRNCSVASAIDSTAAPPQIIGDVIAVIRPYPIRVGNTEDGHSGGWSFDCAEVDWNHVRQSSGLNDERLEEKERTTVTKRIRRVSTFSFDLLIDCCKHNGVTGIFLNFAQYIDASAAGMRGRRQQAPRAVRIFADAIELATEVPVIGIGTGADTFDVLE